MSIVPLLALSVSLVTVVGVEEHEVVTFFCSFLPDTLHELAESLIGDAFARSGVAFSLSTLVLLWSASKGVKALRRGLNAAYSVEETRNAAVIAAISIAAVLVLGVLLAAVMLLVFSGCVIDAISAVFPDMQVDSNSLTTLDLIATLALGTFGLAACYAFLPAERRRYIAQLPGAICATLACCVFSFGFRIYIENFSNFTVLYGSLASVAIFLLWMYLIFYILLAGGFVNRYLKDRRT